MRKKLVTDNLSKPKSLAVFESRVYFLDPVYERVSKVDLPNGDNLKVLKENEPDLKFLTIWKKRTGGQSCSSPPNGGCDHICIPAERRGVKCGCSLGYKLTSETSCSPYKSFLVVAQNDRIRGVPEEDGSASGRNEAMVPISAVERNILHINFHMRTNYMYYIDYGKNTNGLYRVHPNSTIVEPVITKGIGSNGLRGLAVDWIHDQVYFTNAFPHETFVEICKLDGKFRKVLVKKTTESPRELAVNPIKKLLYWIDYGQFPRIGRSYLDGSNWTELVTSGISNPRDLTIDYSNHDVYWVDSNLDTIQKINYNGGSRVVIRRNLPNPVGVAVFRESVYWADKNLASVFRIKKDTNQTTRPDLIKTGVDNLRDVKYFDPQQQPEIENYCNCEQLCYAIENRYVCDCATGRLNNNKCVEISEYVVFSTRTEIRSVHVDVENNQVPFNPITNLTNVVGLDFDYDNGQVLFTQIRPDAQISYFSVRGGGSYLPHVILNVSINPEGIAYDWVHKKVYWTDSGNSSIYAMNFDGSGIVNIAHVDRPRAIVVHPCNGTLFYTDWGLFGTSGRIFKSTMAGTFKEAIIKSDLTQPSGLALDIDEGKLYWTDAVREKIERSDLDGGNREVLVTATIYPFAITIFGDYIFWTDLQLRGVYRADKHTGGDMIEIVKRLDESPRDIQVSGLG